MSAVITVANKTPLALWSLRKRKNAKKAPKFKSAPKANKLPTCPWATAASKVSVIPRVENRTIYNNVPTVLAIRPIIKPIKTSFLLFIK